MTTIFTVCSTTQYPYAKALQNSLPPDIDFKIGIIDGQKSDNVIVDVTALNISEWENMRQRYDEAALIAASKPYFAAYFLQQSDQVIYFDPTVLVLGSIEPILHQLLTHEIVITPRITHPFGVSAYSDEKYFLNSGLIDSSFFAFRKSTQTTKLLDWWQKRVVSSANLDLCNAQNHDQLWLMFLPAFYENIAIVKDKGWNVSLQNLHERVLTKSKNEWLVNQTERLVFINFREFIGANLQKLANNNGASTLFKTYQQNFESLPAIFSYNRSQRKETSALKTWLKTTLTSIIHDIHTFPLYITKK